MVVGADREGVGVAPELDFVATVGEGSDVFDGELVVFGGEALFGHFCDGTGDVGVGVGALVEALGVVDFSLSDDEGDENETHTKGNINNKITRDRTNRRIVDKKEVHKVGDSDNPDYKENHKNEHIAEVHEFFAFVVFGCVEVRNLCDKGFFVAPKFIVELTGFLFDCTHKTVRSRFTL